MKDTSDLRHTANLAMLIAQLVLTVVLVAENLLMNWEPWMIPVLLAALIASWGLMILNTLPGERATSLYTTILMLETFYYGAHSASVFRIAPVAIVGIMLYTLTMNKRLVQYGIAVGYATTLFRLAEDIFNGSFDFGAENVFITLAHLTLLAFAGFVCLRFVDFFRTFRKNDERQKAELESEREKVNDFLTNVSHEIRTPVNAVIGMSRLLEKRELPEGVRHEVHMVRDAGLWIADELENILDYTEVNMDRLVIANEPYMLSSVVNDVLSEIHRQLRDGLELVLDVDPAIPSVLVGDQQKLKKLLRHLIENGIKFTQSGGVYVRLYAMPRSYGVNLCARISDTGTGIDEEVRAHISERFYKKHSGRTRSTGGLGLGLPVVYGFVRLMNGFFRIEDDAQEGARVLVSIPQAVSDPMPCMRVSGSDGIRAAVCLDPGQIDHPFMRAAWQQALQHLTKGLGLGMRDLSGRDGAEFDISGITHLLMDASSYAQHQAEAEALAARATVLVIAGDDFTPPDQSRVHVLRKPFCTFHAVNLLNALNGESNGDEGVHLRFPDARVLVVDDEPTNLMVAEGLLKEYGMQVDTADSGAKAIQRYDATAYDLVFMDHMMPGMDGVEAARQLRRIEKEKGRKLAIVALTANTVSGARDLFSREGFNGFVAKPIDILELDRTLRQTLPKPVLDREAPADAGAKADPVKKPAPLPETPAPKSLLDDLRALGIDTQDGLGYCGSDIALYEEVLRQFVSSAETRGPLLETLLEQQDWQRYGIEVHSVKSTARLIGAKAVSEEAARLESAAGSGDAAFIRLHHTPFADAYAALAGAIDQALPAAPKAVETSAEPLEPDQAAELLTRLETCLEEYDADGAEQVLATLKPGAGSLPGLTEALERIRQYVDSFDFKEAADIAREARTALKGGATA